MCLTHLLSRISALAAETQIFAATIDHAYRPNSALEAADVGAVVREWGVFHLTKRLLYPTNPKSIQNFEEVARTLRYRSLQDVCLENDIKHVFVAHTQDDLLETYLQRLLMNSTMYGLVGLGVISQFPIPPRSPAENIQVYRPLLSFSKCSIRHYCENENIRWFEDVSNQNTQLTLRNKLRYMINEYVPSVMGERPETSVVSRDQLILSVEEVHLLVKHYEKEKRALDAFVKLRDFSFRKETCTFTFSLPHTHVTALDASVLARWLYELVYPISSSKHYHWSYAKFERRAIDKLRSFLEGLEPSFKFNYIGVSFSVTKNGEIVNFCVVKQPPMREDLRKHTPVEKNRWILFDRTWWLRCRSHGAVSVVWYTDSMKRALLEKFPELRKGNGSLRARIGIVPIFLNSKSEIIGLPTHGLYVKGVEGECILKGKKELQSF